MSGYLKNLDTNILEHVDCWSALCSCYNVYNKSAMRGSRLIVKHGNVWCSRVVLCVAGNCAKSMGLWSYYQDMCVLPE